MYLNVSNLVVFVETNILWTVNSGFPESIYLDHPVYDFCVKHDVIIYLFHSIIRDLSTECLSSQPCQSMVSIDSFRKEMHFFSFKRTQYQNRLLGIYLRLEDVLKQSQSIPPNFPNIPKKSKKYPKQNKAGGFALLPRLSSLPFAFRRNLFSLASRWDLEDQLTKPIS